MDDCTIIKMLKQNSEKGVGELIEKYSSYVASVIYRIGGSLLKTEDIEEIAADVFYAVWKNRRNILEVDSLKPYLAQSARNMTKNKFRHIKNEDELNDEVLVFETTNNDELLIQKEKVSIIKGFLDAIKQPDKDILSAYYFNEYKLEDIAEMYKIPISTVKSKIYRGRQSIIKNFEERGFSYEN